MVRPYIRDHLMMRPYIKHHSRYQDLKAKEKKDEELYGLFAALRTRAAQTEAFGKLASGDDLSQVSKLSLGWENDI